jgi:hypothetical protein
LFRTLAKNTTITPSSDTRNDRILEKVEEAKQHPFIEKDIFDKDELILVAGSI